LARLLLAPVQALPVKTTAQERKHPLQSKGAILVMKNLELINSSYLAPSVELVAPISAASLILLK
jgi:hypothetical protein